MNKRWRIGIAGLIGGILLVGCAKTATVKQDATKKTVHPSTAKQSKPKKTQQISQKASSKKISPTVKPRAPLTFDTQALQANAGQVGYGVYYLNDPQTATLNPDQPFIAASVIKVFIMAYLYDQIKQQKLSETQLIGGNSLATLIHLMIQNSDNTATNTLIDFVGMPTLNQFIEKSGYKQTQLQRRMLDNVARSKGLDNYTSVHDTLLFLKRLYQQKDTFPASEMLTIMQGQTVKTKIPSQLPNGTVVANKTGELADVENDIGIVYRTDKPYIIVAFSNQVQNSAGERQAIGALSLAAYQY
jgi:beta-lactamase class A